MKTILVHATIVTMNENGDVINNGAVAFEGERLTYVGDIPDDLQRYDRVIDAKGKIILPGLVNTHGHAAMTLLRGFSDDLPLQEWLQDKMWPMEAQFTAEHVKWGAQLAVVEMIKSGTTCFVDMYDHMDEVAKAVEISGMRGVLCRGVIGLVSEAERERKLEEAVSFARRWNGQAGGRIHTMMAPHAPYTCPPDYIEQIVDKAEELNVPLHIHMSETKREVEQNVDEYGKRPVEHLRDLGVFNRPALVAHAVHLTDAEIDMLAEHQVCVSHNPISNLKLGSGIARVPELLERGVCVGLGTDGAASNNNLDLLEEVRVTALIHKGATGDPTVLPAEQALRLGTVEGIKASFVREDVGALQPGNKADFITVDTHQAHLYPSTDPLSHLVYSASGRDVADVYVDGQPLMLNRQLLTLDEERILFETNRMFASLQKA